MHGETKRDAFFERLLSATPDAIVIADAAGQIVIVNDQATELFGHSREELLGQPVEILIPLRFRTHHPAHRQEYRHAPKVRRMGASGVSLFGLRKDGSEFPAEISLSPLQTEGGTWAITAVRDVTKHQQQEAALRHATEAAVAAGRELEAFSYSVAHDLRAPLRSIDGFSHALLEDYGGKLDDKGKEHLRRVRTAAQRMAQLIDDLLGLARVTRSELHRTAVDLSGLARETMERLRRAAPERNVRFELQEGLVARGDARLLAIVIENLLDNAWKFTARRAEATIEIGASVQEGETEYFVRDDGAGFDMAYAGKLFNAFQRLHNKADFDGTGIGLATVQRIVRRHGGRVWAEGAVGRGATFSFTLPSR